MPAPNDNRPTENSYWVVDHQILAGECPQTKEPDLLAEVAARGVDVEHRRLSIPDVSIPHAPERMADLLDSIDEARDSGTLAGRYTP